MHTKKAEIVPPSSFSEPSEPSQLCPEDKPKDTLRGEQEENPQLVAHNKGRQSGDKRGGTHRPNEGGKASAGGKGGRQDAARVDEEKRADVAGGFGVGRAKL
ncbi:hypothetical protein C8Q73DRAFT_831560 [Cubamyces lactineus]|nr:hypothetical protein C8Q73DRAFT_831560 [Cubamyces lactineus]